MCACSLSGLVSDVSLLIAIQSEGGGQIIACSVGKRLQPPAYSAVHSQALLAIGSAATCVAPQWSYEARGTAHQPGALAGALQFWVGTATSMLHLCSLDGSAVSAPLSGEESGIWGEV